MRDRPPAAFSVLVLALTLGAAPVVADPFTLLSETTWGGPDDDLGDTVAVASDGSVYVAGRTLNFTTEFGLNVFVLKFGPDGSLVWQRTWDIPGAFGDHESHDLAVAPDGSVYVAGRTFGTGGDALLLKFDAQGNLAWQRTWGGSGFEVGEGVAVAADRTILLAGSTQRSFGEDADAFLVRLASDGSILWQRTFGTTGDDGASDVVVAADGNLVLTGGTPLPVTFGFYLAKIALDGSVIWQTTYTAENGVDPRGGLAAGPDGSAVVAAAVFGPDFGLDAAVIQFDAGGNVAWQRSWGGRDGDDTEGVAVAADGNVYLVGSTASFGVSPDDAYLVKILPNGRGKGAVTWGGMGLDKGHDVAVTPGGTIVISGTAEAPPYQFLRAASHTSRLRGTVGVSSLQMTDVVGDLLDPGGVVAAPDGSLTFAGGFDATLLRILP